MPAGGQLGGRGSATSDTISLPGRRSDMIPAATMDESHSTGAPPESAAPARATTSSV
ncbi:precorrin-8X methylmutase subfamily domain protein [Mycobacterium xenopi 3993]|nr:precorrin-8X methylmutase subfamily domain protein [Mycobacterium xenopi 3993]